MRGMKCLSMNEVRVIESCRWCLLDRRELGLGSGLGLSFAAILRNFSQFYAFCIAEWVCRMGLAGLPENRTSPVYGHNSTAQHLYKPTNSRTVCVLNSCVQCIVPAYHTTHHAW